MHRNYQLLFEVKPNHLYLWMTNAYIK